MKKKDRELIFSLVIFTILVFCSSGFDGVKIFWHNLFESMWGMLKMVNQMTVSIVGDSILTLIFKSSITFLIVGIILGAFNAPKGKIGHYLGKGLFWLIGLPISFVLNFIASLIF